MVYKKYDIVLANLSPTKGSEQKGIRPCLVVQNNFANDVSPNTVICPITTRISSYPHTVVIDASKVNGLEHQSTIDILQIRVVSKGRIIQKLGVLDTKYYSVFRKAFMVSFDVSDYFVK